MNGSDERRSKATSGKCTATLKHSEEAFSTFAGSTYLFYEEQEPTRKVWVVTARTEANNQGDSQLINLRIPSEGSVQNKKYTITQSGGDTGNAMATWAITNPASYYPYPAISGSVTVTVDENSATLNASFAFEGRQGSKKVEVFDGLMDAKGFTKEQRYPVTGSVKCDLSESVIAHYASTTTAISKGLASGSFPAYINCWSEDYAPEHGGHHYILALHIAQGVSIGTYPISTNSQAVRVIFIDRYNSYPSQGQSGSITLDSIPDFETLGGTLSGSFNYTAVANGTSYTVKAQNGQFSIEKTKT